MGRARQQWLEVHTQQQIWSMFTSLFLLVYLYWLMFIKFMLTVLHTPAIVYVVQAKINIEVAV